MNKNMITRILRKYLSGRFSSDTEERVQKWIIKDKDIEEKEKASLEYWNELEAKTDPDTELVLDRVNQRIDTYCSRSDSTIYDGRRLFILYLHTK